VKKKIVAFFLSCVLLALSYPAVSGCINGNWHPLLNGVEMTDICCTLVGDGSAASCTDGETWMLIEEGIPEL